MAFRLMVAWSDVRHVHLTDQIRKESALFRRRAVERGAVNETNDERPLRDGMHQRRSSFVGRPLF